MSEQLPSRPILSSEARALRIAALLAVAAIVWVALPVGIGVLLGTLTAFALLPLSLRLRARFKRAWLAALTCIGLLAIGVGGFFAGFGYLLIGRGIELVRELVTQLQPGGHLRTTIDHLNSRMPHFVQQSLRPAALIERLGSAATEISMRMASVATLVAGTTMSGIIGLLLMLLTCYYILQNWSSLSRRAEAMLPLNPRDTRALLDEFRKTGRTVLLGTVLTGIAQGILAGLGYLITGVPEAAFFGALTAAASIVPVIGTFVVWFPLGVYLLLTGHVALGVVELTYGALIVVGVSDYVLRPRLVGGHGEVPSLVTLVALIGGIEAFGIIGLLLGPVVVALAVAILRIYEREATARRESAEKDPAAASQQVAVVASSD
jgi:predicted PurR-regulated permease PerM